MDCGITFVLNDSENRLKESVKKLRLVSVSFLVYVLS